MAETTRPRSRVRLALRIAGLTVLAILAVLLLLALIPTSAGDVSSHPDPAPTHADSVARFQAARAAEGDVFAPCASRLLDHGERTAVAVVLVHGLTNCPRQFVELGQALHERGANVLILRIPRHGLANGDGQSIGDVSRVGGLTPGELSRYGDDAVDIAAGLGRDVRVLGLSMGGVVAGWVAQNRADVDRVVAVAPALTLPGMPGFVDDMFQNLFTRVPNISLPGAATLDHAYEGESTRALAAMYQLAESVQRAARTTPPAVGSVAVVTNANDEQVDNGDITALADDWRDHGADVRTMEFPKSLGLPHDVIDVQQPDAAPKVVYPDLIDLLGLPAGTPKRQQAGTAPAR